MKYLNLENLKTIIAECQKIFAGIKHKHTTSDVTGLDEALENAANIVYTTRDEYDQLEKNGTLDSNATYVITDELDNITNSSVQLWNTSSSLAQQGKYLSYSDQNGGKYLSLMNASDNTAVAHAKLMDGESGEGMDVDADKVKTVDSKGILVEALGETTAQALIDEVAKRVLDLSKETTNLSNETNDLTGRMKSAENSITSLNSNIEKLDYNAKNAKNPAELSISHGNECNLCYGLKSDSFYFNYRGSNQKITQYNFSDGQGKTLFYINSSGLHVG